MARAADPENWPLPDAVPVAAIRAALPDDPAPAGSVVLDHDARWVRRRVLAADTGARLRLDLPDTRALHDGERLVAADGRHFAVVAADEPLLAITGPDLARVAWHVGNRHAPCAVGADRLLVRDDPVMRRMLDALGARYAPVSAPFEPEGGAFGHGRTHGHSHGDHSAHDGDHGPIHAHDRHG